MAIEATARPCLDETFQRTEEMVVIVVKARMDVDRSIAASRSLIADTHRVLQRIRRMLEGPRLPWSDLAD